MVALMLTSSPSSSSPVSKFGSKFSDYQLAGSPVLALDGKHLKLPALSPSVRAWSADEDAHGWTTVHGRRRGRQTNCNMISPAISPGYSGSECQNSKCSVGRSEPMDPMISPVRPLGQKKPVKHAKLLTHLVDMEGIHSAREQIWPRVFSLRTRTRRWLGFTWKAFSPAPLVPSMANRGGGRGEADRGGGHAGRGSSYNGRGGGAQGFNGGNFHVGGPSGTVGNNGQPQRNFGTGAAPRYGNYGSFDQAPFNGRNANGLQYGGFNVGTGF